jgi:hypothetical protein
MGIRGYEAENWYATPRHSLYDTFITPTKSCVIHFIIPKDIATTILKYLSSTQSRKEIKYT